jgi:hypothetical protein
MVLSVEKPVLMIYIHGIKRVVDGFDCRIDGVR